MVEAVREIGVGSPAFLLLPRSHGGTFNVFAILSSAVEFAAYVVALAAGLTFAFAG